MPRQSPFTTDYKLDALFAEETTKATQNRLFYLVTLVLPDPELPFRIVDSNYNVTFGGILYARFPVKFMPAEMNSDGSISKASINIANVSREIMYYVEQFNGLRNCRVLIKSVYANALDFTYTPNADGTVTQVTNTSANSSAYIEDEYYVDTYTATEQIVSFQLDPIIDLEIRLPRRRFLLDSCYWAYGDADTCKVNRTTYPALCNKTFAECKARNNEANFGGFPGISGARKLYI